MCLSDSEKNSDSEYNSLSDDEYENENDDYHDEYDDKLEASTRVLPDPNVIMRFHQSFQHID